MGKREEATTRSRERRGHLRARAEWGGEAGRTCWTSEVGSQADDQVWGEGEGPRSAWAVGMSWHGKHSPAHRVSTARSTCLLAARGPTQKTWVGAEPLKKTKPLFLPQDTGKTLWPESVFPFAGQRASGPTSRRSCLGLQVCLSGPFTGWQDIQTFPPGCTKGEAGWRMGSMSLKCGKEHRTEAV